MVLPLPFGITDPRKKDEPKTFGVFGASLFPGIQDYVWDAWKGPELKTKPDKKEHIVPSSLLADGRLEYEKERAKNLVVPDKWAMQTEDKEDYPLTLSGAMGKLGAELSDRNVQKDEAWWKKALGALEVAAVPLDVPMELLFQAYQDPIAEGLNKQLPTMRGEEYRESFGGFKALGRDQGPEHTGVGEMWERMRRVQELREQRPWHQQAGMLALEVGASGVSKAIVKGIPIGASKAHKAALYTEALAVRAIDLGDLAFGTVTKGITTGIRVIGPSRRGVDVAFANTQNFDTRTGKLLPGKTDPRDKGIVPIEVPSAARMLDDAPPTETGVSTPESLAAMIEWDENKALRDAVNLPAHERVATGLISTHIFTGARAIDRDPHLVKFMDDNIGHAVRGYEDGKTPTHKMRDNWNVQAHKWAEQSANINETPELRLAAARNLAQIQLQLTTASRPGAIEKITWGALRDYTARDIDNKLQLRLKIGDVAEGSGDEAGNMMDDIANVTTGEGGKRTGVLTSLDHDGYFAVQNYRAVYQEVANIRGQAVERSDNALAFGDDAGKVTSTTDILKAGSDTLGSPEIPLWKTGYGIRYQRATELLLRNYSLEQIQGLLGHKDALVTRGYIRDWVHDMSVEIDHVAAANAHMHGFDAPRLKLIGEAATVAKEAMRPANNVRSSAESAAEEVGRAKGKERGLYEYNEFAREVTEAHRSVFFNEGNELTDIGEQFVDTIHWNKFKEMIESGELDNPDKILYAKEMLFLDATRKYAKQSKDFTKRLKLESDGIAAGQALKLNKTDLDKIEQARRSVATNKVWRSKNTGLIQRAKILVTPRLANNKIVPNEWSFEVLGGEGNIKARKEFLTNAGLDPDMNTEDLVDWAQDHMTLYNKYNEALTLQTDHPWMKALYRHKSKMQDVLDLEEPNIADVMEYWVESPNTMAMVERWRQFTEPAGTVGRAGYDPLHELAESLLEQGSDGGSALKALGRDMKAAMIGRLRKDIMADIEQNDTFNPLFKSFKSLDDKGKEITRWDTNPDVGQLQRMNAIGDWAKSKDIRTAFGVHRIYSSLTAASIETRIYRLAKSNPYLFGENFVKMSDMSRKGSVRSQQANDFLDEIVAELVQKKEDLLRQRPQDTKFEFLTSGERTVTKTDTVLRRQTTKGNITIDGLSYRAAMGHMPELKDIVANINRGIKAQRINEFWNKNNWVKPVRPFIDPVISAVMGGRALIARDIAKGMSARAWMHAQAGDNGTRVEQKVQNLAERYLRVEYAPVDDAFFKEYGSREGTEFMTALDKYLLDSDVIIKSEHARGTQGQGTNIFEILAKKNNQAADPVALRARKFMTQWDVVMDEIHPDDWKHYFDFTRNGGADVENVLRYIKGIQEEMDSIANRRGVNVGKRIMDKGTTYLRNYFPRLFVSSRAKIFDSKTGNTGILTSNHGHFEEREVKSIVHQLFDNPDKAMLDNTNVGKVNMDGKEWVVDPGYNPVDIRHLPGGGKVLERGSRRLGHYVESIWKEIAEHETQKWMTTHEAFGKGSKAAYQALRGKDIYSAEALDPDALRAVGERANKEAIKIRWTELKALEGALINKQNGRAIADVKKLELLENSISPEIQQFAHLARTSVVKGDEIPEELARLQGEEVADAVNRLIHREQAALKRGIRKFNPINILKEGENDWLQRTLAQMTEADQREVMRYYGVANSTIAQILLAPAKMLRPINQILRTAKATFDVGVGMIHGYPSLVNIPLPTPTLRGGTAMTQGNWFKANVNMYKYMVHPEYHDNWIVENQPFIDMLAPYMEINKAEQIQLLRADGNYEKIKKWSMTHLGALGKAQVANRFETGFTGFLDVLRYDNAKVHLMELEYYLNKKGIQLYKQDMRTGQIAFNSDVPEVAAKLHEFGASMNKFSGTFDPNLTMMTPTQSFLESAVLFFAPRYRRAAYGSLVDIFRGGMRRDVALRNLAGHVNSWMLYGVIAKEFAGNEEAMDIEQTQKFGKFEVGGIRMGVGTAFSTVFRTAVDLSVLVAQDPEAILEPEDWRDHPVANMLLRRVGRSQMAPASAMGWDILTGKTYLGDPLRDPDGGFDENAIGKHIGRGMIPFWLDGVFAGGAQGAAIAMPAEALGLQAYPIQDYDLLARARQGALENWDNAEVREWRSRVVADARENGTEPEFSWETAPKHIKDVIHDKHMLIAPMYETYRQNHGEESRGESRNFFKYWQQRGEFETQSLDRFDQAARQFETGDLDGRDLVEMYSEIARFKRNANQALLDKSYPDVAQRFIDIRNGNAGGNSHFVGDILYDQWMDEFLFNGAYRNQETGDFIWGDYNEALVAWKAKHEMFPGQKNWYFNPDNTEGYMQIRKRQWLTDSPEAGKVLNMFDTLRPYWRLHENLGWSMERQELANLLLSHSETGKGRLYRYGYTNPLTGEHTPGKVFDKINSQLGAAREKYRRDNPTADWELVKYYRASPSTSFSRSEQVRWERTQQAKRSGQIPLETAEGAYNPDKQKIETYVTAPSGQTRLRNWEQLLTGTN